MAEISSNAGPTRDQQKAILDRYRSRTPKSRAAHTRAAELLPGGVNRNIVYHAPHPLYYEAGDGAWLTDIDGNRYLDVIGNYTAMILGHGNPAVVNAAIGQARRGTAWAGASTNEARLAELILDRLPAMERVRFTASGTEATMMAVRAARAHTGRPLIAKFEGGYHGFHDVAMVSMAPDLDRAGPADSPHSVAPAGIPDGLRDDVVVLPFNRPDAVERVLDRHADRLAGVIVEPVMGSGIIVPRPGFLKRLRDITRRLGILLIFDEVISFRLSYGGAQAAFGVKPDITTLGKVIGGGYPIGAIAGRADIMHLFDPSGGARVLLSGTFQANPVALAAGIATLEQLSPEVIDSLNVKSAALFGQLARRLAGARRTIHLTSIGSLFGLHVTAEPVEDYRSAARGDKDFARWLYLALLNENVLLSPRGIGCLSIPMTEADTALFLRAMESALVACGAFDQGLEEPSDRMLGAAPVRRA